LFHQRQKICLTYIAIQTVVYPCLSTYNIEFMQQGEHSQKVNG